MVRTYRFVDNVYIDVLTFGNPQKNRKSVSRMVGIGDGSPHIFQACSFSIFQNLFMLTVAERQEAHVACGSMIRA